MNDITVRELRNRRGYVLERVARGEALTVTRDGQAIAELRPLAVPGMTEVRLTVGLRKHD